MTSRVSFVALCVILAARAGDFPVLPTSESITQPAQHTRADDLLDVRANFCNLTDARGRVIFTPFLASLWDDGDMASVDDWLARQRAAGSTHIVVAPRYRYPGSTIRAADFRGSPARFRAFLDFLLSQPSADGKGFRPIVMLSDHFDEVERYWPTLLPALAELQPHAIFVPSWEPVGHGWTSAMFARALSELYRLLPDAHVFYHGGPNRSTFASDPLEADDPWHGDRIGAWKSHGGERVEGLLFQTGHGDYVERPGCTRSVDDGRGLGLKYGGCWAGRWDEVVARLGAGLCTDDYGRGQPCGWRKVRVVLFETVAYEYFRGQSDTATANQIATEGQAICRHYGVRCGFGNGQPQD